VVGYFDAQAKVLNLLIRDVIRRGLTRGVPCDQFPDSLS
jgi:hypothetical protein